jgi:hypothetical protein
VKLKPIEQWAKDGRRRMSKNAMKYFQVVKTASVQHVPQQWPEILRWVAAGEDTSSSLQVRLT